MSKYRVVVIALALSLGIARAGAAQSAAAIVGAVTDDSGGALPGVTVQIASPALIERVRTAVTAADGRYQVVDLRPGEYTVTFELTGFQTAADKKLYGYAVADAKTSVISSSDLSRIGSVSVSPDSKWVACADREGGRGVERRARQEADYIAG